MNIANENSASLKNKKILIVSYWGYPIFGGGEQFLYDSMKWCHNAGMIVTWICFADANPKSKYRDGYTKMNVIQTPHGTIIQVPGGFSVENLKNWILLFNPDIVHHQGLKRYEIVKTCYELNIKIMSGVCFWNDIIKLDTSIGNIEILKHSHLHKKDTNFDSIYKWCTVLYTASYFVTDVVHKITTVRLPDVIYSSSLIDHCLLNEYDSMTQKYAVVINCHKLKGGEIVLKCMQNMPHIPFYIVRTEYCSESLDSAICQEITKRNNSEFNENGIKYAKCIMTERAANIKDILKHAKIFLAPSMVDETFCKTVNEAMCNGIPIITTGRGNIKYMVGDSAIVLPHNKIGGWIESIDKLFSDENYYAYMAAKIKDRYSYFSENVAENQLLKVIDKAIFSTVDTSKNIMLFVPWCDQGLGIQARTYVKLFEEIGYNTHIFSFYPYFATESNPKFQADESEWAHPSVFYSTNSRENVIDEEIASFIKHRHIGLLVIPETCFNRVYQVSSIARKMGVKTFCVPNVEIVRKSEFSQYVVFDKILCNNKICEDFFRENGYNNTVLVEYTPIDSRLKFKKKQMKWDQTKLKFLALGGLNSIVRKQIPLICEAFRMAYKSAKNICLVVSIQGSQIPADISNYGESDGIEIIVKHQTYGDIIELYQKTNINLQVSKHEGLGLGFYEAMITGTPTITLDTPPHNEIILRDQNGWLVNCSHVDMTDNTDGLVQSAIFDPKDLADQIIYLANNLNEVEKITKNVRRNFDQRFSVDIISKRFLDAFVN